AVLVSAPVTLGLAASPRDPAAFDFYLSTSAGPNLILALRRFAVAVVVLIALLFLRRHFHPALVERFLREKIRREPGVVVDLVVEHLLQLNAVALGRRLEGRLNAGDRMI